jgi:putative transposase
VALSNRRLVKLEYNRVTFRYTASQTGQTHFCVLPVKAFIQRFLQHVLPKSFVKVRYYGLFSPGYRQRLARLQEQLGRPRTDPLNPPDAGRATAGTDHSPGTPQHPGDEVRWPVRGQAMVVRQILRLSERCPR